MKIICIGRNYVNHVKELGNEQPTFPLFFLKPDSSILKNGQAFFIPDHSNNIQHEVELVVRINRVGKHISQKFAHKYYDEIGLGIDFTARDVQEQCKENGWPWEIAKAFDGAAPLGKFANKAELPLTNGIGFQLFKNDVLIQDGNSKDMLFSIDEIIAYVSTFFTLKIGDLIYTGTPAGVSRVVKGDVLVGKLEGKDFLRCKIL